MSDFDLSAYLGVFLDEIDEQLQILDIEVLQLEKDPENPETIQNIFRAAHTLKGSSAAMGFHNIKNLTHHVENVFEHIRQQKLQVNEHIIEMIFESIDHIKQLKLAVLDGKEEMIDISKIVEKLNTCNGVLEQTETTKQPQNPHELVTLNESEKLVVSQGIALGYHAYDIKIALQETCLMRNVRALLVHNQLAEESEIIATFPTIDVMENDENFNGVMQFLVLTLFSESEITKAISSISEVQSVSICVLEEIREEEQLTPSVQTEETPSMQKKVKVASTVRVDVDKLEHLMNLVGELVIDQTRLVDVRGRFAEKSIGHEMEFEILDELTNHFNRVVTELQEGMMKTRMLPIEQLFNRFPRMVRDTATKAQKDISFEMRGKETELDRTLIEEISDPIIHLLRNAVDHGIESAEERKAAGKALTGKVILQAAHEENNIVISISDDGKGIDPEKVKAASVAKGIITADAAKKMSNKEAMFLIFNSGISTAEKITDISGRGVGMDIVRSHIEKLNGIIDIESKIGKGTTFTIKLPLTLAIIRSLLVKFGTKTFAIPLVNVLEIIRLNTEDIQRINEQEVGMVRGRVLPLVRMNEILHIPDEIEKQPKKREFVVVVGIADKRIGIIADKTLGNQEVVIKSLGNYIGTPPFISGATIMGDGSVALILDVSKVVKTSGAQSDEIDESLPLTVTKDDEQLLAFRLHTEEYGIDIERVKDIIAVPKITKVVESANDLLGIINLRGNMLPVYDLRRRFSVYESENTKKSRIIIIENGRQDVGFLVDEVTQVVKTAQLTIEEIAEQHVKTNNSIQGVTKIGERIIFILSFEQILASLQL